MRLSHLVLTSSLVSVSVVGLWSSVLLNDPRPSSPGEVASVGDVKPGRAVPVHAKTMLKEVALGNLIDLGPTEFGLDATGAPQSPVLRADDGGTGAFDDNAYVPTNGGTICHDSGEFLASELTVAAGLIRAKLAYKGGDDWVDPGLEEFCTCVEEIAVGNGTTCGPIFKTSDTGEMAGITDGFDLSQSDDESGTVVMRGEPIYHPTRTGGGDGPCEHVTFPTNLRSGNHGVDLKKVMDYAQCRLWDTANPRSAFPTRCGWLNGDFSNTDMVKAIVAGLATCQTGAEVWGDFDNSDGTTSTDDLALLFGLTLQPGAGEHSDYQEWMDYVRDPTRDLPDSDPPVGQVNLIVFPSGGSEGGGVVASPDWKDITPTLAIWDPVIQATAAYILHTPDMRPTPPRGIHIVRMSWRDFQDIIQPATYR